MCYLLFLFVSWLTEAMSRFTIFYTVSQSKATLAPAGHTLNSLFSFHCCVRLTCETPSCTDRSAFPEDATELPDKCEASELLPARYTLEDHRKQRWLTLVPQSSSAIAESLLQIGC